MILCWSDLSFILNFLWASNPSLCLLIKSALATKCSICNLEFATDRDLRYHNRECKNNDPPKGSESRATKELRNCKISSSKHKKPSKNAFNSTVHNPSRIDKPPAASVPVQIHSADITGESKGKEGLPSKPDDCPAATPNHHSNRDTNALPTLERDQKDSLRLPKSSDPIWPHYDAELRAALPLVFNKSVFNTKSPEDLTRKFDNWLYSFFQEKCGTVEKPATLKASFTPRPHKGLARLREDKRRIRRIIRTMKRAGLQDTPEWKMLKVEARVVMRKHNRLRTALYRAAKHKKSNRSTRHFKKDPFGYTKNLFNPSTASGDPSFSKESAQEYFVPLYRDEHRDYTYHKLPEMTRPNPPKHPFNMKVPSLAELHKVIWKKKNGAAPGLNKLPYLIYKKCPSIVYFLHLIIKKVWNSTEIPDDWAMAYISLIAKTLNLDQPSEFRPIAVGDSAGKIFFSIVADRLQDFMINNDYIKRSIQKGFLSGVAGCIEHPFTLYEALRDAFENTRSICSIWIDLANAFGSVRHNLIQFALEWYHVPKPIQLLILKYYDKLCAKIVTKNWSSMFFLFDIGCFQGCVLSAILFDCVFNLLLDYLRPLERLGYTIKSTLIKVTDKAYADDLNLTAGTARDCQKLIDRTDTWLDWTQTMKAKPAKCVSLAYRQFKPESNRMGFTPLTKNIYSPYDPLLTISGKPVRFIWNREEEKFQNKHFKFLGRWISVHINELEVQQYIESQFLHFMSLIDKDPVNSLMKLWMYQFGVLGRFSWSFMSQDHLPLSLALKLDRTTNRYLKSWCGLFKSADLGVLYRPRDRFGLGLTKTSAHFKKMGIIKCLILKNSDDLNVRELYNRRATREQALSVWRATQEAKITEETVAYQKRFPGQTNRLGLGNGLYDNSPSIATHREKCSQALKASEFEKYWSHSHTLSMQSIWSVWFQNTHPLDFSWNTIIHGPGKQIISFLLNATINTLPSPYLRRLMGYRTNSKCKLCKDKNCNVSHILSGCREALISKRYTWRHDSVLLTIYPAIRTYLDNHNSKKVTTITIPPISHSFTSSNPKLSAKPKTFSHHLLSVANDWKVMVDSHHEKLVFPPEIFSTNLRPDILIWSPSAKKVLIVELTVGCEENIEAAYVRKTNRYTELMTSINDSTDWHATIFPIEVGARGFVGRSTSYFCRKIGFTSQSASKLCKSLSLVAARCSHNLWLHRENRVWTPGPLLTPSTPDTKSSGVGLARHA